MSSTTRAGGQGRDCNDALFHLGSFPDAAGPTMRELISQAEINALLQGLANIEQAVGQVSGQDALDRLSPPGEPLPFFIPAKEHLHRGPWPGLQAINEQFARIAPEALVGLLPQVSDMQAGKVRQHQFGAFLAELPQPSHCYLVTIEPLSGWGLVVFDARLTLAASAKRFAGASGPAPLDAIDTMSSSELARAGLLLELIISGYNKAWHAFAPLNMVADRLVAQARLAHIAAARERVVSSSFHLPLGDVVAAIHICLPHASLLPLQQVLRCTTHGHLPKPDRYWHQHLTRELQSINLTLAAKLARFDVTVAELLSLQTGDVLPFEAAPVIEATVDGVPLFACEYGTLNGRYALRIDQSLRALEPARSDPHHGN